MATRRFEVACGDAGVRVELLDDGTVSVDGHLASVERAAAGEWRVVIDGRAHRLLAAGPRDALWVWYDGIAYRPEVSDAGRPARTRTHDPAGSLAAPMPATVRAIAVSPGDRVARGATLIVLEAMKMELPLKAPADGVVAAIGCQVGDLVQPGVPLVTLS